MDAWKTIFLLAFGHIFQGYVSFKESSWGFSYCCWNFRNLAAPGGCCDTGPGHKILGWQDYRSLKWLARFLNHPTILQGGPRLLINRFIAPLNGLTI